MPFWYPLPCPKPEQKCDHEEDGECKVEKEAFGYFASVTAGGVFAGGLIPFTYADPINRNVVLLPPNTAVSPEVSGIYRIVYSVTAAAAAPAVSLQLLVNTILASQSPIPILAGVNVNEIFLRLTKGDNLSLNLTGAVTLAAGKNASLLLQLIDPSEHIV